MVVAAGRLRFRIALEFDQKWVFPWSSRAWIADKQQIGKT
jgi:hypothetical protein